MVTFEDVATGRASIEHIMQAAAVLSYDAAVSSAIHKAESKK